ncbi:MAG: Hsp20/alpha crystallin family protein [Chloroflexi bacterium]|nr:Hsp20/alpha crystallin family protein [Chloroflexota bacterium]
MPNIVRWDPFNEMTTLRDAFDRVVDEAFLAPRWITPLREGLFDMIAIDLIEQDDALVVKASVPGFKPDEIDISVVDNMLTIKGETRTEKTEKKEEKPNFLLRERRFGLVHRRVRLPAMVEADKARAEFENGVLTLTLPKAEAVKAKHIKVLAKSSIS